MVNPSTHVWEMKPIIMVQYGSKMTDELFTYDACSIKRKNLMFKPLRSVCGMEFCLVGIRNHLRWNLETYCVFIWHVGAMWTIISLINMCTTQYRPSSQIERVGPYSCYWERENLVYSKCQSLVELSPHHWKLLFDHPSAHGHLPLKRLWFYESEWSTLHYVWLYVRWHFGSSKSSFVVPITNRSWAGADNCFKSLQNSQNFAHSTCWGQ